MFYDLIFWQLLAYVTGTLDRMLLNKLEYVMEENRIYKSRQVKRFRFTDEERRMLAEKAKVLGKQLADVASVVKPDTLLKWYRNLIAKKWDYSDRKTAYGRPPTPKHIVAEIIRIAKENPPWGCDRIAGAVSTLDYPISDTTVENILKKHGIPFAPDRDRNGSWHDFIKRHSEVIWAADFFTEEVLTPFGLLTCYVLFFIHIKTRKVVIGGINESPREMDPDFWTTA